MFDIGATELLVIAIVAILVIGPKDLPLALRTVGRWVGKIRRVSSHFRTGLDAMVREAEMEDFDRQWREKNERIMAQHPADEMGPMDGSHGALSAAEAREMVARPQSTAEPSEAENDKATPAEEPRLTLGDRKAD